MFLVCCLLAMQTLQQQPIFGKKRKERVTVYSDWQIRLLTFCWHNLCILVQEGTKTDCMWPNGTNNIFMQISKFIFYTPISSLVEQILMKSIFHVFNVRFFQQQFVCIYTKLQVFQFTTDNCTFLKYCNDCYYNKYMYFGTIASINMNIFAYRLLKMHPTLNIGTSYSIKMFNIVK